MPVIYPVQNNIIGSPEEALRQLMYLPFRPRNPNRLTEDQQPDVATGQDLSLNQAIPALLQLKKLLGGEDVAKEAWAGERREY